MANAGNDHDADQVRKQPAQPGQPRRNEAIPEEAQPDARPVSPAAPAPGARVPSLISRLSPEMQGQSTRALNGLQVSARQQHESLNEVLPAYGGERVLARLVSSGHADQFALKGGHLLRFMLPHGVRRATRDVDLMANSPMSEGQVRSIFTDAARQPSRGDGVAFDVESLKIMPIREKAGDGYRVNLDGRVGVARIYTQTDIGFNDIVAPAPERIAMPSLNGQLPAVEMRAYTASSIVAEKYEAMVRRSMGNSRMKDFYDVAQLSQHRDFRGEDLKLAIQAAFTGKSLTDQRPVGLTPSYYDHLDRQAIWTAFARSQPKAKSTNLADLGEQVWAFLKEPVAAAAAGRPLDKTWDHASREWK